MMSTINILISMVVLFCRLSMNMHAPWRNSVKDLKRVLSSGTFGEWYKLKTERNA